MSGIRIEFKKSLRARRVRITVQPTGMVTVTAPRNASRFLVERFLREKKTWIEEKVAHFQSHPAFASPAKPRKTRKDYLENRDAAKKCVEERLTYFNHFYGFSYNAVSIRNQKTRWGSCSKKRNLNFNYKIIFLTPEQQDYIIVHELCHLKEFNHGKAFWHEVSKQIPEYARIRKSIRTFAV